MKIRWGICILKSCLIFGLSEIERTEEKEIRGVFYEGHVKKNVFLSTNFNRSEFTLLSGVCICVGLISVVRFA